ncbi:unnamed protein product [Alopecurus aequalis]
MATAAATRPSGPVLLIPNYGSASPNRVKLSGSRSPAMPVSVSSPPASSAAAKSRQSCMCSPTNHPGSFRCSRHKDRKSVPAAHSKPASPSSPPPPAVIFTSSGTRILARRALAPSQQSKNRRRVAAAGPFRSRPSRLSAVSFGGDNRQ